MAAVKNNVQPAPGKLQALIERKEFVGTIIALLGAYFLFPYFFETHIYPLGVVPPANMSTHLSRLYPWLSLDPSWHVALNKFNIDHLNWGKDVTFTYGPLAYLSTRVGWGISRYHLLLYDLFLFFNFYSVFYAAYVKSDNKKIALLLIAATCFFLPSTFASGNALVLMAFLIFWIRQGLDGGKPLYYIMQIAIIVLVFFIKFNTSLVSFFLFVMGLAYQFIFTKEKKWLLAVYLVVPVVLVLIFSKIFNVSVGEYLVGGLNMVSGYNEIMYLTMPVVVEYKYTYAIIFLSVFIFLWKMYLEKKKDIFKNLVSLGLFSASIYILYKQSFVRNDIQHILDFNKFSMLFVICAQDLFYRATGKYSHWLIVVIVICAFMFSKKREDRLFKLGERFGKGTYFKELANFSDSSGMHLFPNNNQIPDSIKSKIGKSTVDIYPWNIHLLFENKLNYKPRPTPQAYTAYTPYLENLNFDLYNSDAAPEFVIYDFDAIDGRSALYDESKLNMVIMRNYEYKGFFNFADRPQLLLKKKQAHASKISLDKVREFEITPFDNIQPKEDNYYEIFVSNTLSGKVSSLLSHSPEIFLVVKTKDGAQREFKISKKLLESGIYSNRLFNTTQDVFNYLLNKNMMGPESEIVAYSLRFATASYFSKNIKVIEYKINQP